LIIAGVTGFALMYFAGAATADHGNDNRTVRMRDDCDPASFNAVLGPGACVGDGHTTFDEFNQALVAGGDHQWRFNPAMTGLKEGHGLQLVNRGGEGHTFTKVDSFAAGGCVPPLNEALGLPGRDDAFCAAAFSDPATVLQPGGHGGVPASMLMPGTNRFQCMIHPWMTTTVKVVAEH
jgi:plastocyanin